MIVSDQQREENYQDYLNLLNDPDYIDVSFDEQSGGVSAVHRNHRFDKQMGRWSIRTKIGNAIKQGASTVVLYFTDAGLFSLKNVQDGWKDYLDYINPADSIPEIQLLCVVGDVVHPIEKPSW